MVWSWDNPETAPLDQAVIPVQFVLKQARMAKIIFLNDQQGIMYLTDLKHQGIVLAKEPDLITPGSACRNSYHDISVLLVPHNA
jgi:hypothetical protein